MPQPKNNSKSTIVTTHSPSEDSLVSCLMLTARRVEYAPIAIKCFQRQTWSNRELVIVYDAWDTATLQMLMRVIQGLRVRLVRNERHNPTVGFLRNMAVNAASGQYCIQWDDDDAFHPDRITRQMNELRRSGKPGCVLDARICHVPSCQFMFESTRAISEGTALIATDILRQHPYPNITRVMRGNVEVGEDTMVVIRLYKAGMLHIFHCPELYLHCVHTTNACSNAHWQTLYEKSQQNKCAQYSGDSKMYHQMVRLTQVPDENKAIDDGDGDGDGDGSDSDDGDGSGSDEGGNKRDRVQLRKI